MAMRIPEGKPTAPAFTLAGRPGAFPFRAAAFLLGILFAAAPAHAVRFPDTSDLKKDYRVAARKDGRPSDFYRKVRGDSASLHLEWAGKAVSSARFEQSDEFDPDSFSVLTSEFGNGAAWHENMGTGDLEEVRKLYPGLRQEWILKGYGGEKGWLASGVVRGRYFLVFRESPPIAKTPVPGPLRLNPGLFAMLDSSSEWLHVPCREERAGGNGKSRAAAKSASCFSPAEDPRLRIRIDRKKPLALQAWMEEGESGPLADIKKALEAVPDDAQAEYAKDLSQMLTGEALLFLVKLAQRLPGLFNWPSWQIQDFRAGRIPSSEFLPLVRRQSQAGEFLPAFRYQDGGIRLSVNLYYQGTFHLSAEDPSPGKGAGK